MRAKTFNKVFGIGLSRTGTTSLNEALNILGIRSIHYPPIVGLVDLMKHYDGATDTSVTVVYKKLDRAFPNSKFILTTRDIEDWLNSCRWFFSKEKAKQRILGKKKGILLDNQQKMIRTYLYGDIWYNEETYRHGYYSYHKDVMEYFKDRPQDLLVMNVFAGDGFNVLCPFLGTPVLRRRFPHKHARGVE